jgi:hypothetical protein
MHRPRRTALALAGALLVSGCYGPFNLTRRLYRWNGEISGKWEREFVFLLLAYLPVYGLAVLGDAVVFNSMEFWTGNNPVDPPSTPRSSQTRTRRLARGDDEVLLSFASTPEGAQLLIEQFRDRQAMGAFRVKRRRGLSVGVDGEGKLLFTAQTMPNGDLLIRDGDGRHVASYSAAHVERVLASARGYDAGP